MSIITVGPNKQFQTIQDAVDSIPSVMEEDVFINIDAGNYKEIVDIKNKHGYAIILRNVGEQVNLQQIKCFDVSGLVRVSGARFVWSDQIENSRGVIHFSRTSYGAIEDCTFEGKTRKQNRPTCVWDGSNGSIANCYFHNQHLCIYSLNNASIAVRENDHSSTDSKDYLVSSAALIFDIPKQSLGKKREINAGRIF
ncbi:hypothetical protein J32TS6_40770 [Virgibacillus pantothenticus]|uniref:pectinesterase family protein n=1 Tax=Virgibacillus TaxID=84406 RepID=UPI00090A0B95|nr:MULTISPECIES: pectinesterase family protein [Virgibacillus]API91701.1 hypothetical protein BKP57_07590 [Virgibacillus sp. 6R]MBS7427815.1 hypothetical protein [Virgibacillus sp. 19R1-5]GIP65522.1 hypothetical protein J32TS6_40770 [Virgibacillus pantothenticus]